MHNLNYNQLTNKYAFFSKEEIAWHQKGQIVSEYLTSREALNAAQLNYHVDIKGNTHNYEVNGQPVSKLSTNSFFTYRTDTGDVLGDKIGKKYQVVQNLDAFTFFDAIVGGEGGIMYETAGALGNGETIFITAKLPDYIRVGNGDDVINKYLFLTTSHDGSGSIIIGFTPVRIVCNNTLNAALRNCTNVLRIKHTAKAQQRLLEAHKIMEMTNTMTDQLTGILNQMATVRITDPEVKKLIQIALASKETLALLKQGKESDLPKQFNNAVDTALAYAFSAPSQVLDTTKGTVYGALNAVTGYFQNVRDYDSTDTKMKALFYGGIAQQKGQLVFNLCTDYMKHGSDALLLN